jgi:hypothetical protein
MDLRAEKPADEEEERADDAMGQCLSDDDRA